MLVVSDQIQIPDEELQFTFSRSGGPGGQNVNKVSSKATLRWNPGNSPSLPDPVRDRFLAAYESRLTNDGDLLLSSGRHRDQPANVAACLSRLAEMIRSVEAAPTKRRATRPTRGSRQRRLKDKKVRSERKQNRRPPRYDD